jgi:hypothetical protein
MLSCALLFSSVRVPDVPELSEAEEDDLAEEEALDDGEEGRCRFLTLPGPAGGGRGGGRQENGQQRWTGASVERPDPPPREEEEALLEVLLLRKESSECTRRSWGIFCIWEEVLPCSELKREREINNVMQSKQVIDRGRYRIREVLFILGTYASSPINSLD